MSSQNLQNSPYLRIQRGFPDDNIQALTVEIDKSYIDIAYKVNVRTIGIFALNTSLVTGETWYLQANGANQTLRKLFKFTTDGNLPHGIDLTQISGFTKIYGTFTDGTNWYPVPYVATPSSNEQLQIYITPTDIVIEIGGGTPTISYGYVILEYLSNI